MASGRPRGSSVWDYFEFSEAENKSVCVVNAGDSKPDSEPCGAKIADPIEFWLSSAHSYPKLFDVATDILSVPASSAPVERVFSVSGDACRGKRNHLSGQNLERETLLRVNKAILL